ncbi:hypothetical protein [Lacinutrix sp. MEBiC02595]
MSFIKTSILSLSLLFLMVNFSNCSSTKQASNQTNKISMQDFQENPSFILGETSFKYWTAGVKGGGSGVNLFILMEKNKNNIVLDTVYFRGRESKLEAINSGYVANFRTLANQKEDIIMSTNKSAEYGNEIPNQATFPFQLKDNECVISYIEDNITKYFKIENLVEKARDMYPSAPPQH